jgi:hypothetical protein
MVNGMISVPRFGGVFFGGKRRKSIDIATFSPYKPDREKSSFTSFSHTLLPVAGSLFIVCNTGRLREECSQSSLRYHGRELYKSPGKEHCIKRYIR